MKRIYFDHAAATPIAKEVLTTMSLFWSDTFGNPSSIHKEGVVAQNALSEARKVIADELGAHPDEIIFTGSATESCNLALRGTVGAWKATHPEKIPHIIVCVIEHDAVLASARVLQKEGSVLTIISVDKEGLLDINELVDAITMDTVIISVGYVNNEIGVVQPLREVAHAIRRWKKDVRGVARDVRIEGDDMYPLLHTDASQATNYLELKVPHLGVDMLTINAAKIYGPKGVGLLLVRRGIPVNPITVGGGHERGLRAGTENVPLIAGFATALQRVAEQRVDESVRLALLRDHAITKLRGMEGVTINGSLTSRIPNNINISIRGVDHEFFCLALDAKGFAVSTKSACNESDAEHSHVLEALCSAGHDGESSGLRITLGRETTKKDINALLLAIVDVRANLIVASS
ncbi:MAG: Aminotransferase [Parcubacteria group bacterium GW2011_GWA2_47_7]|nr:MAG: Aminotransferase [Parcubacteria group bacterium GW2011_GWA2_47_7]